MVVFNGGGINVNKDYKILKEDLANAGIKKGDSILLHSSYKSMGGLEGGIKTFVEALLSILGDNGTLIVPTLTYAYVTEKEPVFDHINTPSCVGAISEFVRNMEGAKRSINPTHSCSAIGSKRDFYISGHEKDCTPIGENSPIYKLHKEGGKILMLGCSLNNNTSMHGVEEHFRTSYVFDDLPKKYSIVTENETYEIDYFRHYIVQHGYQTQFARVEEIMDEKGLRKAEIHGATSFFIDAALLWKTGFKALEKDEFFFVDEIQK